MFSSWFIIILIMIFIISNEWIFLLSIIFLSQIILNIFKSSWNFALFFISFLMIVFWLFIFNVMHTSCINITKLQCFICAEFAIFFTHFWDLFRAVQVSELITCNAMFLLFSLQSNMIKFYCAVDTLSIFWKIWSVDFFCIFFIFIFFIIFTKILHLLWSDDKSFLNCCFFIIAFSLAMLIHDDALNMKHIFSYIWNCLLKSWMNAFNFCTSFVMNASWFSIFFSEMFQRCWISFKITSFHKWSLFFFFLISISVLVDLKCW